MVIAPFDTTSFCRPTLHKGRSGVQYIHSFLPGGTVRTGGKIHIWKKHYRIYRQTKVCCQSMQE